MPQIRVVLASVGATRMGGANQTRIYVRLAPHAQRTFSLGRLISRHVTHQFKTTDQGDIITARLKVGHRCQYCHAA